MPRLGPTLRLASAKASIPKCSRGRAYPELTPRGVGAQAQPSPGALSEFLFGIR